MVAVTSEQTIRAKVGKWLPNQFPKPPLVGKQNVGNFTAMYYKTLAARNCWNDKSPVGNLGGANYIFKATEKKLVIVTWATEAVTFR